VRFIKSAQRLGFSLDEIADLLKLEDGSHCTEAREQAERKLADVRDRLADLRRIEVALQGLVVRCCATSGQVQCPLIAALQAA
jgi:MerR family mercuric resistance operon transcriptional regulator